MALFRLNIVLTLLFVLYPSVCPYPWQCLTNFTFTHTHSIFHEYGPAIHTGIGVLHLDLS